MSETADRTLTLQLDLTNKCNLRCAMCHFADDNVFYAPRVEISAERFREFGSTVLPRVRKAMLSCGTEPLLAKAFVEALAITREYGVPQIEFTTNATRLDGEYLRAILDQRVDRIQISIDGVRRETYETVRVGSKYERVIGNVKRLTALKRALGADRPVVQFNLVLMRFNVEEAPAYVRMAHELGVEELDYRHVTLHPAMGADDQTLSRHKALSNLCLERAYALGDELGVRFVQRPAPFRLSPEEQAEYERLSAEYAEPAFDDWRAVPTPAFEPFELAPDPTGGAPRTPMHRVGEHPDGVLDSLHSDFEGGRELAAKGHANCPLPFEYATIRAEGDVYPCPFWAEEPMGNIHRASFDEIWHSERYRALRRSLATGELGPSCRNCPTFGRGQVDDEAAFSERAF
jgi:radical SAM protein with 4Fe4S-binding SPASM domain